MLSKKVKSLAKKVRKEVEIWVLGNPDIDPVFLDGACAIASYTLFNVLRANGYNPSIVYGRGVDDFGYHCWVTLDKWVIDLTYSQFDSCAKVYVTAISKYEFEPMETGIKAIRFINKWQAQSPVIYKKDIKQLTKALTQV